MRSSISKFILASSMCLLASTPVLAATWEQVSQESQEVWVPDIESTRSVQVTVPVLDWVPQENWKTITTFVASSAVTVQRMPLGESQKGKATRTGIGMSRSDRSSGQGGAALSGTTSRNLLGADRSNVSSSKRNKPESGGSIQRGPAKI